MKGIFHQQQEKTLIFLVTLFGLIFQGSDGVKDVQLEAPRYARLGEDLMLRCNYDLETDSLYAVKWYRGSEEFYRFLPKEAPPKQAFPISGVVVDVNKSNEHGVFLRNLSFETNGRFKCVISAEGTFQTLENAKDIDVVVIDYNSPKLFLDKMSYSPGERGLANCSIERTFPAPNITWFINGKKVNLSVVTRVVKAEEEKPRSRLKNQNPNRNQYMLSTLPTATTFNVWRNISMSGAMGSSGSTITSSATSGASRPVTTPFIMTTRSGTSRSSNSSKEESGEGSKLTSSISTLSFSINGYSPLKIKCTGQLYDVYNETSSFHIQPKAPPNPRVNPAPSVATPKWNGLPDQLQTFNASHNGKDCVKPAIILVTLVLMLKSIV